MHSNTVLLALVAAVSAIPLNINLGAYSPALVVGDGEISLGGGAEGASQLMATLAQGAQQGAAGGEAAQQGQQGEQAQQGGEAAQGGEAQQGEQAQQEGQPAEGEAAKRGNLARDINEILKRAAAPEPTESVHIDAVARAVEWIKRDINSFNAALGYAERAQQNQPKVELGTGEGGAGVGIIVNPGLNVPANSAANGAAAGGERKVKRSEVVEDAEAPKMTLVAITEV